MQDQTTETPILDTRIPEGRAVPGLEYGAHYSDPACRWSGYYVRAGNCPQWGIARLTPASDELEESGGATVRAIAEDLERVNLDYVQRLASDAMNYGRRHGTGVEIVRHAVREGIADQRQGKTVIPFADGSMLAVEGDGRWSVVWRDPDQEDPHHGATGKQCLAPGINAIVRVLTLIALHPFDGPTHVPDLLSFGCGP